MEAFNILLKSNRPIEVGDADTDKDTTGARSYAIKVLDNVTNKAIDNLFLLAWELACIISDLKDMFL